jgi:hypothetical protein
MDIPTIRDNCRVKLERVRLASSKRPPEPGSLACQRNLTSYESGPTAETMGKFRRDQWNLEIWVILRPRGRV